MGVSKSVQVESQVSEFAKVAKETSEASYGKNLTNFSNLYDPEDVVQETALSLVRKKMLDVAGERLTRISVSRMSISMARRMQSASRGYARVINQCNLGEGVMEEAASDQRLEHEAEEAEEMELMKRRILTALNFILPKDAQIVRMRFLEGKTVSQIAKELGVTKNSVDARVRRGIKAVRQYREDIVAGCSVA